MDSTNSHNGRFQKLLITILYINFFKVFFNNPQKRFSYIYTGNAGMSLMVFSSLRHRGEKMSQGTWFAF